MMSCQKVTRLMSDAQDRELKLMEKLSLKAHVLLCGSCKNFNIQMEHLRTFAKAYMARTESNTNSNE